MQSKLDQFLRHVHRRWIVWRALERIGLCALMACGFAALLAGVLIYRRESALLLVAVLLLLGIACGIIIALVRRPTLLDTAAEVDRQLELHDLLATAWSLQQGRIVGHDALDEQWRQTILAQAEQASTRLPTGELVLRRLGARAWGGIGVGAALVLTMGLISTNPLITEARDSAPPRPEVRAEAEQAPAQRVSPARSRRDDAPPSADRGTDRTTRGGISPADATASAAAPDASAASAGESAGEGTGAGTSRTDPSADAAPLSLTGTRDAEPSQAGTPSAGAGRPTEVPGDSTTAGGVTATDAASTDPWRSATGAAPSDDSTTGPASVPEAYRDIVRDYFSRE